MNSINVALYTAEEVLKIYKDFNCDLQKTIEATGYAEKTVKNKLIKCGISFRGNRKSVDMNDVLARIEAGESKQSIADFYDITKNNLDVRLHDYNSKHSLSPEELFQQQFAKLKKVDHTPKKPFPVVVRVFERSRPKKVVMTDITDMFMSENQDDINYYRSVF